MYWRQKIPTRITPHDDCVVVAVTAGHIPGLAIHVEGATGSICLGDRTNPFMGTFHPFSKSWRIVDRSRGHIQLTSAELRHARARNPHEATGRVHGHVRGNVC